MNKEIDEMARLMCETCKNDYGSNYECCCDTICQGALSNVEALYNADYRKVIWHKVADGDLPKAQEPYTERKRYWCHFDDGSGYILAYFNDYTKTFYDHYANEHSQEYEIDDIDFWTELPMYEGEENEH